MRQKSMSSTLRTEFDNDKTNDILPPNSRQNSANVEDLTIKPDIYGQDSVKILETNDNNNNDNEQIDPNTPGNNNDSPNENNNNNNNNNNDMHDTYHSKDIEKSHTQTIDTIHHPPMHSKHDSQSFVKNLNTVRILDDKPHIPIKFCWKQKNKIK